VDRSVLLDVVVVVVATATAVFAIVVDAGTVVDVADKPVINEEFGVLLKLVLDVCVDDGIIDPLPKVSRLDITAAVTAVVITCCCCCCCCCIVGLPFCVL
jgi:hypothetical protein